MTKIEVGKTYKFQVHMDARSDLIQINGDYKQRYIYLEYSNLGRIRNLRQHENKKGATKFVIGKVEKIYFYTDYVDIVLYNDKNLRFIYD
jgi:hypothetical protein